MKSSRCNNQPNGEENVNNNGCCANPLPDGLFAVRKCHRHIVHCEMIEPIHVEHQNQKASNRSAMD